MGVLLSELLMPGWADEKKMAMTTFSEGNLPCHTAEPETFFSEDASVIANAKALCGACPMKAVCLQGALERSEPCGVWGGELFDEGKIISHKRSPGRPRIVREELVPVITLPIRPLISSPSAEDGIDDLEMVG
jgi:WhiB family redox-sensing transcriptional regulator